MEMLPDTADMLEVLKNAFPVSAGVGIAAIGAKLEELKKEKELRGVAGPSHRVEPRTGGSSKLDLDDVHATMWHEFFNSIHIFAVISTYVRN